MSRSRRKPYWTEGYDGKARKTLKRAANKRVRSKPVESSVEEGGAYKKEYESWHIRDWSFHDPKNPKARRK